MADDPPERPLSGAAPPDYVRKQPWYFNTGDESVDHQKIAPFAAQRRTSLSEFYHHGQSREREVVKWKPGSCTNCGSTSHREADCTERPRRKNARISGESIAPKEVAEHHDLSYDAKRDAYSNFGSERWWFQVRGRFRVADQVRAQSGGDSEAERPTIQAEYGHSGFRNRHDVAGYLQNPQAGRDDGGAWAAPEAPRQQPARSEPEDRSNPAVERQHAREFYERRQMLAKTSGFVADAGAKEEIPKSRYGDLEDRFQNGHTTVFGSFFQDGRWGYACCRQFERECLCTATRDTSLQPQGDI
jgi:pre-mRNA-processing factor SLU7